MNILLVHRYFYPDTPAYAVILKKIATRLASDGHDVEVFTTQPSYKPDVEISKQPANEMLDGYRVRRIGLLPAGWKLPGVTLINMLLFTLAVVWRGFQKRKQLDVIMISTSPPVLAGWAARVVSILSNAKFVYHYMDIHPEIGQLTGEFRSPLVFSFLKRIDQSSCQRASKIVVLSDDMKRSILNRENAAFAAKKESLAARIEVIQNFSLDGENPLPPTPKEYTKPTGTFRIVFAGNIGRFQGLRSFVDTFLKLSINTPVELLFIGSGKLKEELAKMAADAKASHVQFVPHQPLEIASSIIQDADLGLVSLNQDVYRYAYPTKTIAYLGVGCPLLAVVEPESALARFVQDRQIGVTVPPGEPASLQTALSGLICDQEKFANMKANAKQTFVDFYGQQSVLDRWSELFEDFRQQVGP